MITLTVNEIYDLARFAGLTLDENVKPDADEGESTITIGDCPDKGLFAEVDQVYRKYRHAAWLEEYPEEGMVGLGDEIPLENQESTSKPESAEQPPDEGWSSSALLAKVLARLDQLALEVAHLTQHTVPCTRKNGEQPYKCAYHPTHKWTGDLCPDHAKRVGKPHRDLHLANAKSAGTAPEGEAGQPLKS